METIPHGARFPLFTALFIALVVSGCSKHSGLPRQDQLVLPALGVDLSLASDMAPGFRIIEAQEPYNRIGQVIATGTKACNKVDVDPDHAVFYSGISRMITAKSTYTNLVYRVHFTEQPYSLLPFHFGAGSNVGVLVILTLDQDRRVVLVTTAQTCGCYAVTLPTAALPEAAYPTDWPSSSISIYGERLPARLPAITPQDILVVAVRPEVHRVMDMQVVHKTSLIEGATRAIIAEMDSLKQLPLEDGTTTSLYYRNWPLTGHVRGAIKPWETLFLGLVSLDFYVGMDKEYGNTGVSGNPFYTSLKPWNRTSSDMNDFGRYLHFNGWNL
ncbi:MAG: hypothetical protein AB7U29_00790 [Desulfobulbus sp.]